MASSSVCIRLCWLLQNLSAQSALVGTRCRLDGNNHRTSRAPGAHRATTAAVAEASQPVSLYAQREHKACSCGCWPNRRQHRYYKDLSTCRQYLYHPYTGGRNHSDSLSYAHLKDYFPSLNFANPL